MDREQALAAAEAETTPVAVVDEAVMEANLARMAALAAGAGLALRPHAKTHKSVFVARRQLALGAAGLTVATLREAEVFAAAGVLDLVLAHPPVGAVKLARLAALAASVPRLAVALDDLQVAAGLPAGVEILWEVDSGLNRLGTAPGRASAEAVRGLDRSRFRGLMTHGGHVYRAADEDARQRAADEEAAALTSTAALLRESGVEVRVLSVGSTPTAGAASRQVGITEMRPGTYVYGDANQVALGSMGLDECALGVVATVVSTPAPGRAVIDAGSKALSNDLRVPGLDGFGIVLDHPQLRVDRMGEEHGILISEGPTGVAVGDRVVVIPAHVCTALNLQAELLFFGAAGRRWEPVDARGWR